MDFCMLETNEPGRYRVITAGNDSFLTFFRELIETGSFAMNWNQVLASGLNLNAW